MNTNEPDPRPVLVTGANGFLGSHLVDALLHRHVPITGLIRPGADTRWLDGKTLHLDKSGLHQPPEALAAIVSGHDVIFHVAGAVRALNYPGFLAANADNTERLLQACLAAAIPPRRFVLVSSVGATGPAPLGQALTETQAPGQLTDYGRSKLAAEMCAQRYAEQLELVVVRPTAIYGARDREMLSVFQMAQHGFLPAFAGPDQIYNLCHVSDIVQGIVKAGWAPLPSGQVFLLGAAHEYSARQVAAVLGQCLDRRVRLLPLPRALLWSAATTSELWARLLNRPAMLNRQKIPELVGSWRLDLSRARAGLGYTPRWDLPEGIGDTLRWYQSEGIL